MAIVIGIVSQAEKAQIVHAGYTLADHPEVRPALQEMPTTDREEAVAVWVDCDIVDLLILDKEHTSHQPSS